MEKTTMLTRFGIRPAVAAPLMMLGLLLFGFSGTASAVPCGSGDVSDSTGCQNGVGNNDSETIVNDQAFFGYDDWVFLNKYDVDEDEYSAGGDWGWMVEPGPIVAGACAESNDWAEPDGCWSFDTSVWDNFADVMIVVKTGNNDPVYFSGYLLEQGVTEGFFDTGDKDVSHLTLYARGDGDFEVPEPTSLAMLGAGLLGMGLFRRRRKV